MNRECRASSGSSGLVDEAVNPGGHFSENTAWYFLPSAEELAVANKDYKVEKHRNDLVDSEQLVYPKDPNLHFMTADRGYLRKVVKSPFRSRIHEVPGDLFSDGEKLQALLRQIVRP